MPSSTREIKRRIKSVSNIKQITHAMELVAASKMKRAQKRSTDADAYAYGALEILENITRAFEGTRDHPYWKEHTESDIVGIILIASDRGFCGGLNVTLFSALLRLVKELQGKGLTVRAVTVGKKGRHFVTKLGVPIVADFTLSDHFSIKNIRPIARVATEDFKSGQYRKIYLCYNQFLNTLTQRPVVRQLLPITLEMLEKITETDKKAGQFFLKGKGEGREAKYIFEPGLEEVFESIVPYLVLIAVYKAALDASASEHSARMIAMRNATDKAEEFTQDLKLAYNQARQAGITREIAEISAGRLATR